MNSYISADQYLHYLAQLLAHTNVAFQKVKADDSHTNLFFEGPTNRLFGQRIMIPDSGLQYYPAIHVLTSTFELVNQRGHVAESIELQGGTFNQAMTKLSVLWEKMGLESLSFEQKLHYSITSYSIIDAKIDAPEKAILLIWSRLRSIANEALGALCQRFLAESTVRIWPHHFDTAVYFQVTDQYGIGAGLAMADDISALPYFYISAYNKEGEFPYETPNASLGEWIFSDHWKGAILPATKALMNQPQLLSGWLNETTDYLRNQMG